VSGTAVNLLLTALCAYPLSKKRLLFRPFFMTLIIFTMFFNGGLIPRYLLVQSLGMIDTIWAIIIPAAIRTWYMIIMRTFFQSLPDSLEESAYIDGANDFQIFIKIYLPLSKAIVATLTVFYSVEQWNNFFPALIYLNSESKFPLQIILRNMVVVGNMSEQMGEIGQGSDYIAVEKTIKYAVIMVSTLPIMLVYPFLQRYFVKGVMVGSLKA
jgi:putative aldouronate transport system permease protein